MSRWVGISLIVVLCSAPAHAQSRAQLVWTISGAGAGFGIGLWAGLSAFDDAVNSDRKVWTSALVGASVGALAGYLIGRTRKNRTHSSSETGAMAAGDNTAARAAQGRETGRRAGDPLLR